uniref:Uncharacterized protein n=1 Tax=Pyxicephalus adspersus TaxID=30357 RepID=A0AAV3ADN4_PYXAD|nr:TPA: hypothetical protein GDO54_012903 [Pyxicephalus adspersus]
MFIFGAEQFSGSAPSLPVHSAHEMLIAPGWGNFRCSIGGVVAAGGGSSTSQQDVTPGRRLRVAPITGGDTSVSPRILQTYSVIGSAALDDEK